MANLFKKSAEVIGRRARLRNSLTGAATVAGASVLFTQTANAATLSSASMRLSAEDAFIEIKKDEDAHVSFIKGALGDLARPKPKFKGLE